MQCYEVLGHLSQVKSGSDLPSLSPWQLCLPQGAACSIVGSWHSSGVSCHCRSRAG